MTGDKEAREIRAERKERADSLRRTTVWVNYLALGSAIAYGYLGWDFLLGALVIFASTMILGHLELWHHEAMTMAMIADARLKIIEQEAEWAAQARRRSE